MPDTYEIKKQENPYYDTLLKNGEHIFTGCSRDLTDKVMEIGNPEDKFLGPYHEETTVAIYRKSWLKYNGGIITQDQLKAAVNWWCDALRGKAVRTNNGDRSNTGLFTLAFQSITIEKTEKDTPDLDQRIDKFGEKLLELLSQETDDYSHRMQRQTLSVDYHPGGYLRDAAEYADVPSILFPIKTVMWIFQDGSVDVANGYGAPAVTIYSEEKVT